MVNMAVLFQRANYSLQRLAAELDRRYPGRIADLGFVTGYKSAGNFTGHNADSNGICHAMDIGTQSYNGQAQSITAEQGRELAEILRLLGKSGFAPLRYGYIIHDMGETDQRPMIAGAFNGWDWQTYNGPAAHSDHIHVSTIDLYWGDPVGIPPSVYDSTQSWGIAQGSIIVPSGNKPTPIEEGTLSAQEVKQIQAAIKADGDKTRAYIKAIAYKGWIDENGDKHYGFMKVIEETQNRVNTIMDITRDWAQGIKGIRNDGDSFNLLRRLLFQFEISPDEDARARKNGKK